MGRAQSEKMNRPKGRGMIWEESRTPPKGGYKSTGIVNWGGILLKKSLCLEESDEPRPKGRGLPSLDRVSNSAQTFGFEIPGPEGPGFRRPDEKNR